MLIGAAATTFRIAPWLRLPWALWAPRAMAGEPWRVIRELPAPWAVGPAGNDDRIGRTVQFRKTGANGPGVLECGKARFETAVHPPEGLFQGNLPVPAAASARAVGIAGFPVAGFRGI